MITEEQALSLGYRSIIHENGCRIDIGKRGGKTYHVIQYRVASRIHRWKTRPNEWEFTVKFGMNSRTYTVNQDNAHDFHLEKDCPLNVNS